MSCIKVDEKTDSIIKTKLEIKVSLKSLKKLTGSTLFRHKQTGH
jgi:hypothetical protein